MSKTYHDTCKILRREKICLRVISAVLPPPKKYPQNWKKIRPMKGTTVLFRNFRGTPTYDGSMMFHGCCPKIGWLQINLSKTHRSSAATTLTIVVLDRDLLVPHCINQNVFQQLVKTHVTRTQNLGSVNFRPFPGFFCFFLGISVVFPGIPGVFPGIPGVFPGICAPDFLHVSVTSTDFTGFHGLGAIQAGMAAKSCIGSDPLNTGDIFQQKTASMIDTQVSGRLPNVWA